MSCKSQNTNGEGESILRKLWLSQDSAVSTLVIFPIFPYGFVCYLFLLFGLTILLQHCVYIA